MTDIKAPRTTDPDSGVLLLGTSLPYSDGAEQPLLEIMHAAADRSSGSDELARHIRDWPTRYHLSRLRANLLKPLSFPAGARVLDVGAGTGALSRYLGEQGLEVTALEGSLDRARVAAARCDGLEGVEVVCGALADLDVDEPFDAVVCVGVLEYAGSDAGGAEGPEAFLARLAALTAPGGALVLAIENQLGLKYLLGYPEDHLGHPWEGVEGYQQRGGPRTYSRVALERLLCSNGFVPETWLYPYPDYKLPQTILAEATFQQPDTARLVDQLVRRPVAELNHPRTLLCDDRGAHRTFLEAGLGADVANSFLVIARRPGGTGAALVPDGTLAWHFGSERLAVWRQDKRLLADGGARSIEVRAQGRIRERGWLRHDVQAHQPFHTGETLEQQILHHCAREDVDGVAAVLRRWDANLAPEEQPVAAPVASHPFVSALTTSVLPPVFLDCNVDNFLELAGGEIVFFDQEWHACAPVDSQLVRLRALWNLASALVLRGAVIPWPAATTVDELTLSLMRLATRDGGLPLARLRELHEAEAQFQSLVTGTPAEEVLDRLERQGEASRAAGQVPSMLPFTRLRNEARRAQRDAAQAADLKARLDEVRRHEAELSRARREAERELDELRRRQRQLEEEARASQQQRQDLEATVEVHEAEVLRVHSRLTAVRREQDRLRLAAGHAGRALRLREEQLQRLGEHTVGLQRGLRALLVSKSWRLGDAIGRTLQRLLPGRRPSRYGVELAALVEAGFRMLDGVVPVKPEPIASLPELFGGEAVTARSMAVADTRRRAKQEQRRETFRTFGEYLAHATTYPLLEAPFTEAERRVLGVMDSHQRQLAERYGERPQDVRVSIVLPTYNRRRVLPRAIGSVLAQRYSNWELLVVDDGSTDGTQAYVEGLSDERIRCIGLPSNRGVSAARNAGLEAARGDVIAYLDSDNSWHPDYLLVMVGALSDSPWAETAYCAQEIYRTGSEQGREERQLQAVRFAPFNRALLEHRNYVDLNAFVHTRSIVERLGGFDTSLRRLVDWELLLRYTAERGICAVPCVLSTYEFGAARDQLTHTSPWHDSLRALMDTLHTEDLGLAVPPDRDGSVPRLHPVTRAVTTTTYRRPVAVVIPSFEALDYLRVCIESVQAYTQDCDYRLVVVDNGSGPDVREYLKSIAREEDLEVVLNDSNLGFTHAVNIGIQRVGPERDVILLNNDAVVTPGWVQALWEVFDRVEDSGLVAGRQTLLPGTPTMDAHVPYSRADRELDVTLSSHHGNVLDPLLDPERGLVEVSFVPFFSVYIPRTVIDEVGLLNAENAPHYRSDRLYCDMVRTFAGKRIVYTPHSKLYHFLQQSTKQLKREDPKLYEEMFVRNDWTGVSAHARPQPPS